MDTIVFYTPDCTRKMCKGTEMAKDIFKRLETKYLLTKEQYRGVRKALEPYMRDDEYGLSKITSIYYDTPNYDLARESMEKPVYKEKLRLRAYGQVTPESTVYLELKKKYDGVVYKRRISLSYSEADLYLKRGIYPDTDSQIMKEIDYFFKYYDATLPTYVEYMRIASFAPENPDIRITYDTDIKVKYNEGCLLNGKDAKPITSDDTVLMEIKAPGAMPLWLTRALSDHKVYPHSFSKYGTACGQLTMTVDEGEKICWKTF